MHESIAITGGAGFIGSNLALGFKEDFTEVEIQAIDNLKRSGSELNLSRLRDSDVEFIHCDIRNQGDLAQIEGVDLIIHAAAESSVLAGYDGSPRHVLDTNLDGTVNVLEMARREGADVLYLSSSRVYPYNLISKLNFRKTGTRFELEANQSIGGISKKGLSEEFPIQGTKSFYGASKAASEFLVQEYISEYDLNGIINRCGLVAGPLQMGKEDQGVVALWVLSHLYGKNLRYIGFDGKGRQVRDVLHVRDLYRLIRKQSEGIETYRGEVFNAGGGKENSISLQELTKLCEEVTGRKLDIGSVEEDRPADIPWYITDNSRVSEVVGWEPQAGVRETVEDISEWIQDNKEALRDVLM